MSAKKRKGQSPWYSCENCNAIIIHKDTVIHREKGCPPNPQTWIHSFIRENSLFSTFETFNLDDQSFRFISKEERNDFVLMPMHVLQLCKIPIGDRVVVKVRNGVPFVKVAWPHQEKPAGLTVALPSEVSELYQFEPNSEVIVSKFEDAVLVASTMTIVCETDASPSDIEPLLPRLEKQNANKIYRIDNKILLKHYGRTFVFRVVDVTLPNETGEKCENAFYVIGPETKLVLHTANSDGDESKDLLSQLGGLNEVIEELMDFVSFLFQGKDILPGLNVSCGVLVHGPTGTGKTTLVHGIAERFTRNIVKIESSKVFSKVVGETERELQKCFDKAKRTSPSVIVIDDIDVLCSGPNSTSESERRIVATLTLLMDTLNRPNGGPVVVLATTSKLGQIDQLLRSSNRFAKEVEIHVPTSRQRLDILNVLLADVDHGLTQEDVTEVANASHGYVGADLASLASEAILRHYKSDRRDERVSVGDFQWALGRVKPSAMREIAIDVPNVKWDDIGGQEDIKLKLKQCVEWPLKHKDSFTRLGITPPKGVLLFGPPGCSKTMIAKAIATESGLNFISVKGPELFSKWVGESERAVRTVFRRARQCAPSVVFFDELDAIGGERNAASGSGGANVQERVLAQLLVEMDGVESLDSVTVIAATNRPDRIDAALLRPGRLDRIVYVPLPDAATRREILRLQLKRTRPDEDVEVDTLVDRTEGYSGAETVAVCREAALKALEENFQADNVKMRHFLQALDIVRPRTPKSLIQMYEKYLLK